MKSLLSKIFLFLCLTPAIAFCDPGTGRFSSCSAAATGTSDTAIKAAVTGYRIYVTDIVCDNTASVSSEISFKNGTTQVWRGAIGQPVLGMGPNWFQHFFSTPLELTVSTAFNFAMETNATSTKCCAAGYLSNN